MTNIEMKFINHNPDLHRIIAVIIRNNVIVFALVVKRQIAQGVTNYCVYLELSEEDYILFSKQPTIDTDFSFFGIQSVSVNVPKEFCGMFLKEQPEFFIGNHNTYTNGHVIGSTQIEEMIKSLILQVDLYKESINGRG